MSMIVSLSGGGIKGAVASARYAGEQDVVIVHIDYGQPSARAEIEAVEALASSLPRTKLMPVAVPHVLNLQGGGGADGDASKTTLGDSEAVLPPSVLRGLMPMLLSVGVQAAFRIGASTVVTGMTSRGAGAHLGLPSAADAAHLRPQFVHGFAIALEALQAGRTKLRLEAPLMDLSDGEVIKLAGRLGVNLQHARTCQSPDPHACGKCEPCRARARAFSSVGVSDPATVPVVTA